MFPWLLMAASLSAPASAVGPQSQPAPIQQHETKLQGVSAEEVSLLITKLEQAQAALRAGKKETFELLTGAPAFYAANEVTPRATFLGMSFRQPWSAARSETTGLWRHYELRYFPPGPHSLMWKVNVVVGQTRQLVRVEMLYTAPPPF
jgi:hypothetical protein